MGKTNPPFKSIITHDGETVRWDKSRITATIKKAILAVEPVRKQPRADRYTALLTDAVIAELKKRCKNSIPHMDTIDDAVLSVFHRDFTMGKRSMLKDPEKVWMRHMIHCQRRRFIKEGKLTEDQIRKSTAFIDKVDSMRAWNSRYHCDTVNGLNAWFRSDALHEFISAAEAAKTDELNDLVGRMVQAMSERHLRAILICGPSSSGKTTTTRRALRLFSELRPDVKFKSLEVDNYFRGNKGHEIFTYEIDGHLVPDYNFELPWSYDVDLINEHLAKLMKGQSIMVPSYDFATQVRTDNQTPLRLAKNEILLIDCLHALSPELTEAIPPENKLRVYIEAMNVLEDDAGSYLRWTDLRLMRRMLRDVRTRGHSMETVLWHWHLVRRGERFIFPYICLADVILNGGLPYELPILKHYVNGNFVQLLPLFERNPDLSDGRERAKRILSFLGQIHGISDSQIGMVPKNSILREFIGGSEFF